MNPKFMIWIGAVLLAGMLLLWGTHCGYEHLKEVQEETAIAE